MIWILMLAPADARRPKKDAPPPVVEVVEVEPTPMTNERLADRLATVSPPEARKAPNFWEIEIQGLPVIVVTDEAANRMRIMVPVAEEAGLTGPLAVRLLQANFDSALDARYAVAQGFVWATFIHPLSSLTDEELASGLAQVIGCAQTYGTSFSSGALVFGGGDSGAIQAETYREVLKAMEMENIGI